VDADSLGRLEANLAVLPPMVRRALESTASDDLVQIHTVADVVSASLRTADGRWVRIHSGRDPVTEADRFVEAALGSIPGGSPAVVIVIGPGLGYMVDAIEQRAPDTKVIAIEPFPRLARAMLARRDWRARLGSGRLAILVGPEYLGVSEVGATLDGQAAAFATVVEHPVVKREYVLEAARGRAAADQLLRGATLNAAARKMFAGRYLLNTLANVPAIVREADASSLSGRFAGVPAIVVAAGPSLDGQLEQIKAVEDRALIVSVDTALRPLQAAGIRPHLVVAVDPSELNARHLLGIDDTEGSWFVSEGSIDPRVLPEFAGRVFSFKVSDHQPWPWLRTHGVDRGTLRAWGSVLTTAFDLACLAWCDPLVFVGADLAYTGGLHYCRGTMNEDPGTYDAEAAARAEAFAAALRHHQRPTCEEADVHGRRVTSTPQFVQFRDWLVSRAVEASPRHVLNATGAGILHGHGISQVSFGEMSLPDLAGGGEEIRARLAASWNASVEYDFAACEVLERAITTGRDLPNLPLDEWREFTGAAVPAEALMTHIVERWQTAPLITAEPEDVVWVPAGEASFSVGARGGPEPTIQWQGSTDGGETWANIAGAKGATYSLTMDAIYRRQQFRAVLTNVHGSASSSPAAVLMTGLAGVVNDFNGDGKPDILWRNLDTGANTIWLMDGVFRTGLGILVRVPVDDVDLAGSGDFDGDGQADILWRNPFNGCIGMWLMKGITGRKDYGAVGTDLGFEWTLAATGDFNGDGKSDIVWRHSETGATIVWFMDGRTKAGEGALDTEPDLAWTIVATADFNGDGKPDILWRHSLTGANRVWFMDGLLRTGVAALDTEADLAWTVVGTGDFNGDGHPDILWRHSGTGDASVWYMNGVTRTGEAALEAVVESTWLICPDATAQGAQ
jgi:hypothetical protein